MQSPDQISVISAPVTKPDDTKPEEHRAEEPRAEQMKFEQVTTEQPRADQSKAFEPKADDAMADVKGELPTLGYCFALYDYDAEASDELNLEEGQVRLNNTLLEIPNVMDPIAMKIKINFL